MYRIGNSKQPSIEQLNKMIENLSNKFNCQVQSLVEVNKSYLADKRDRFYSADAADIRNKDYILYRINVGYRYLLMNDEWKDFLKSYRKLMNMK
jgi:hypothetical protein